MAVWEGEAIEILQSMMKVVPTVLAVVSGVGKRAA